MNGQPHVVDVDPDCPLLYVLRDTLALNNPRFGCGLGQCGACTVLMDNRAVRSCSLPVSRAAGKAIVTVDGLGSLERPHPVQEAFIAERAMQCGYCVPGMILTTVALLKRYPKPTQEQVVTFMGGNLCRCNNYVNILRAVHRAAGQAEPQTAEAARS